MRFGTSDTLTVAMIRSVNVGLTSAIDNGVSAPGVGRHTGSVRRLRACGICIFLQFQRRQIPRSDIVVTIRLGPDPSGHLLGRGGEPAITRANPGLERCAS